MVSGVQRGLCSTLVIAFLIELRLGGSTQYEGEFVKGKPQGAGKFWNENGDLVHEGEYFGGVYHGIGTSYGDGGIKRYEGMYRRGNKSGKGKLFNDEGDVEYQGQWFSGELDGKGVKYHKDGSTIDLLYRGGKIVEDMSSYVEKGGIGVLFGKAMESKLDLTSMFGPKSPTKPGDKK